MSAIRLVGLACAMCLGLMLGLMLGGEANVIPAFLVGLGGVLVLLTCGLAE